MNHQISIVGSQLLPIYVGIKEFNPDKVHFIVSNESSGSIIALKPLLNSIQFSTHNCDAFDFFAIKATCEKIVDKINSNDTITFNLTGGTKIMVLACQALIIEKGLKGFYINQDDTLLELPSYTRKKINTELTTKEFLDLSGHNIAASNVLSDFTAEDFKMSSAIEAFANSDKKYIVITNHFRKKYNNANLKIPPSGKENIPNNIELTWNINTIVIKNNGKEYLSLKSKNIHQLFFNTGWWELQVAKEMSNWGKFKELLINCVLPFKIDVKSAKNEIDVLLNTGKKLIFVECKSGNVKQEDVNKMKAIKQTYGGLISRSILVSRFLPSPTIIEKCKELDIDIFYCYAFQNRLVNPLNKILFKLDELNKKVSL
ncbi:MAG: DUF1887 family CARF protein [Lacibacter sp.]